jgi:hypothetical protein
MARVWYNGELVDAVVVVNDTTTTSGEPSPNRDGTRYDRVYIVNASG